MTCQVHPQADALRKLVEGEVHFALYSMNKETYADIEALPFMCDPILLIVPLDHPWAQRGEIEPHELDRGRYDHARTASGTYGTVREALAQFGDFDE